MTRLLDLASKLSGCLAGVCAILAVLSTASSARADDLGCDNCCAQTYTWGSIEWNECVSRCMQGAGPCAAASQCPTAKGPIGQAAGCVNGGAQCTVGGNAGTCGANQFMFCDCMKAASP